MRSVIITKIKNIMIEHYEVSPDWDNDKIRREYSKRETRQLTYRISTILIIIRPYDGEMQLW